MLDQPRAIAPLTFPLAVCRMEKAETALTDAQEALDRLHMAFDLIHAMAKWMAERVPELAAAAQSAALGEIGFTHHERHEGMTFGMAYGDWRACGRIGCWLHSLHRGTLGGPGAVSRGDSVVIAVTLDPPPQEGTDAPAT